jgi:hypothetical protein
MIQWVAGIWIVVRSFHPQANQGVLFSGNVVSFSMIPVSARWLNVLLFFPGHVWAIPPPHRGSTQHSSPPPPGGSEILLPFTRPPVLFRRCLNCLQAALDFVVPSREDDVAHLPGKVLV